VVTGRLPGPPLWRVNSGEHVLYIFPTLSPVPEGMIWDSERVAYVLEQSQEVLLAPDIDTDFSVTMMLNPINLIRGARLMRRLTQNPDGATLAEVLPAELYRRYQALTSKYSVRDGDLDRLRPLFAGTRLAERIEREEGLVSEQEITRAVERLIRRTRGIAQTDIAVTMDLRGSFRELSERAEALVASLSFEQELECFAEQLTRLESELDDMKSRANAWAQGRVDVFRGIPLPGDANDQCLLLLVDSSEYETIEQLQDELDTQWLAAAERALAANTSTFALLDIVELLREDGVVSELGARGYEVHEPGLAERP